MVIHVSNRFSFLENVCFECNSCRCECTNTGGSIVQTESDQNKSNYCDDSHPTIKVTKQISETCATLSVLHTTNTIVHESTCELYETSTIPDHSIDNNGDDLCMYNNSTVSVNSINHVHNSVVAPLVAHSMSLGLRGKGLHIGHLNVQGIRSTGKHEQIT